MAGFLFSVLDQFPQQPQQFTHLAPLGDRLLRLHAVDHRSAGALAAVHPAASICHRWRVARLSRRPRMSAKPWRQVPIEAKSNPRARAPADASEFFTAIALSQKCVITRH